MQRAADWASRGAQIKKKKKKPLSPSQWSTEGAENEEGRADQELSLVLNPLAELSPPRSFTRPSDHLCSFFPPADQSVNLPSISSFNPASVCSCKSLGSRLLSPDLQLRPSSARPPPVLRHVGARHDIFPSPYFFFFSSPSSLLYSTARCCCCAQSQSEIVLMWRARAGD